MFSTNSSSLSSSFDVSPLQLKTLSYDSYRYTHDGISGDALLFKTLLAATRSRGDAIRRRASWGWFEELEEVRRVFARRRRVVGSGSPGEITLATNFFWGKSFRFRVAMNAARPCSAHAQKSRLMISPTRFPSLASFMLIATLDKHQGMQSGG
jgi:hypothetical protein